MKAVDWQKYIVVFGITLAIFLTALYFTDLASERRLAEIQAIEDKIAIDILSSETQFNLLSETSCANIDTPVLSEELNSLTEKLSYTEENLGADNEEVIRLKRYYSLLQIKDYLLTKKISEKCGRKTLAVLYFYSNLGDCTECDRMGYVLTYLRNEYPELRVYAFDYNLELSALKTLRSIVGVENKLPAVVVNNDIYYGFRSIEEFDLIVPELKKLRAEKERDALNATSSKVNE